MVFEPSFVKAMPGDHIKFVPTNPSHNAETMPNLIPAAAKPVKGIINKPVSMAVSTPGLYGIKCLPHYSMGMVMLVQVGKPTAVQIAAFKAAKLPPLAAKRMNVALAKVK